MFFVFYFPACTSATIFRTTDLEPPCLKVQRQLLLLAIWDGFLRACVALLFWTHPSPTVRNLVTFSGDAGGRRGGGGRVPVSRGLSAPGCGFGDQRGGEGGVAVCGVGDVAQLVLCLGEKQELVLHEARQRLH